MKLHLCIGWVKIGVHNRVSQIHSAHTLTLVQGKCPLYLASIEINNSTVINVDDNHHIIFIFAHTFSVLSVCDQHLLSALLYHCRLDTVTAQPL